MMPFRFISTMELRLLEQGMIDQLSNWQNDYLIEPLKLSLHRLSSPPEEVLSGLANQEGQVLALYDANFIPLMTQALFQENAPSYLDISQKLALGFISSLFKEELLRVKPASNLPKAWQYPGSPGLILRLSSTDLNSQVLLNPSWVYPQLSKTTKNKNNLTLINEALTQDRVQLDIQLLGCQLPLKQLKNLQAGDVLLSDHAIKSPMQLKYQDQTIAEVILGQGNKHKSIKVERFL